MPQTSEFRPFLQAPLDSWRSPSRSKEYLLGYSAEAVYVCRGCHHAFSVAPHMAHRDL